ncbi:MAG: hypothetical protein ACOYT8_06155 [Candidatus Dependentiae bacterium]
MINFKKLLLTTLTFYVSNNFCMSSSIKNIAKLSLATQAKTVHQKRMRDGALSAFNWDNGIKSIQATKEAHDKSRKQHRNIEENKLEHCVKKLSCNTVLLTRAMRKIEKIEKKRAALPYPPLQSYKYSSAYKGAAVEFDWLKGYMVKLNVDRLKGAEILNRCIQENNLDLIAIPKQWVFQNYVVAEKIEGTHDDVITLKKAQQLWTIVEKTHYIDLKPANLIHCANGKIAIIDTELRSFKLNVDLDNPKISPNDTIADIKLKALFKLYANNLDNDAQEFLDNNRKEICEKHSISTTTSESNNNIQLS